MEGILPVHRRMSRAANLRRNIANPRNSGVCHTPLRRCDLFVDCVVARFSCILPHENTSENGVIRKIIICVLQKRCKSEYVQRVFMAGENAVWGQISNFALWRQNV